MTCFFYLFWGRDIFVLYHILLHSTITDRVWTGTGSLCFQSPYQNNDCVVVMAWRGWKGHKENSSVHSGVKNLFTGSWKSTSFLEQPVD